MRGLAFTVTCPQCGSDSTRLVNQTRPNTVTANTEVVGIVACCGCSREWMVDVVLRPVVDPETTRARKRQEWHRRKALV